VHFRVHGNERGKLRCGLLPDQQVHRSASANAAARRGLLRPDTQLLPAPRARVGKQQSHACRGRVRGGNRQGKGRVVAGHWRDEQNPRLLCFAVVDVKVQKVTKRAFNDRFDRDIAVLAFFVCEWRDVPVRFHHHAAKCPLCDLTPSFNHINRGVSAPRHHRVVRPSVCRCPKPLISVASGFHQVVGQHILQLIIS